MKRVRKIIRNGKLVEKLTSHGLEARLEIGLPRIEVTDSTINIVNASKLVNGQYFLYSNMGTRSLEVDEDFSELVEGDFMFTYNNSTADFGKFNFPEVKSMTGIFMYTPYATGYPLEFPNATNFQYPFRGSNLKRFLYTLPFATSLYCASDLCANLESVDTNLPLCANLYHAFAVCHKLKTARVVSPRCDNYQTIFWEDKILESVDIINANSVGMLARIAIDQACINCPSLLTFSMTDTSRVYSADEAFKNTPKLEVVPLSYPLLSTGKGMFQGSNLSAEQINAILASLPRHMSGTHIITFTGCPGAATCDPTIGSTKGWTVEI